jgi:phosphatidyl-myo-inositol dimannoside synthase
VLYGNNIIVKKILFINLVTYSQTGGIENYNKNIIQGLADINKCDVDVVSIYDIVSPEIKGINFYNFKKNKLKASVFIFKNLYKYNAILASHVNIIPILAIVKIFKPSVKIFISVYGIEVWKKFNFFYKYFLSRFTILPISHYTQNIMMSLNKLSEHNFKILYCASTEKKENNFKNVYDIKDFNILSVTRLDSNDAYKGIDTMIRCLPLISKIVTNLKYTVIGKGNDLARLKNLAKELTVEKYIDFKGFVDFIEPYYCYCDVFSLPSKGEGFGIVYIEAMNYKKPCIACDEGGQTDVVIHEKTGCLCPYGDINRLSENIIKLYKYPILREEFGQNGYSHFKKKFTFDEFKKSLSNLLF